MTIHAWEAICFTILILLILKPVKSFISNITNKHSSSVKKNLDDSTKIRIEAEESSEYYTQKQKEFSAIITEINENSEYSINKIHQDAEKDLQKKIEKKRLLHEQTIAIKKEKNIRNIHLDITRQSFEIVQKYLEEHGANDNSQENLNKILNKINTVSKETVENEN
jgi:F0F1-type ATP synthase membrane subunit b/b'